MNWIVSDRALSSVNELDSRAEFIRKLSHAKVTPWREQSCKDIRFLRPAIKYYQCSSEKGEYGFFITAHMNIEVQPILLHVLTNKKAIVVINSCAINDATKDQCLDIIKTKNPESELYFAKQTLNNKGQALNYCENVGTFGFATTVSERELFQNRSLGLTKALRVVFEKVVNK